MSDVKNMEPMLRSALESTIGETGRRAGLVCTRVRRAADSDTARDAAQHLRVAFEEAMNLARELAVTLAAASFREGEDRR